MDLSTWIRSRPVVLALAFLVPLVALAPATGRADASATTSDPVAAGASVDRAAAAVVTHKSWNPHVRCRATVTTLRKVLGDRQNKLGGATYRGGKFRPGIPDRRDFTPPCFQQGVPTFVQINRVKMGSCSKINIDGDWTCNLTDPTTRPRRPVLLTKIHVETDQKFRTAGGWSIPPGGRLINVQGFVFWDPGHTKEAWHFYSGWEIHSFTAWHRAHRR
ncbi:MAG: hypothetical protein WAN48_07830 [Actinomycetes bacterium]